MFFCFQLRFIIIFMKRPSLIIANLHVSLIVPNFLNSNLANLHTLQTFPVEIGHLQKNLCQCRIHRVFPPPVSVIYLGQMSNQLFYDLALKRAGASTVNLLTQVSINIINPSYPPTTKRRH